MSKELAAPGMVDPTSFHLDDPVKNADKLKQLKKKPCVRIARVALGSGEQIEIFRTGSQTGSIYSEYQGKLGLYIQYHVYHYPFLPVPSITQTKLWRSKDMPVSNTFSPNLFFKVILGQSGAVLSDIEHTPDGEEFWKRRLREALTKNLNVALVDFSHQSFKSITSKKELEQLMTTTWGGGLQSQRFKQIRWMIWK